MPSSIQSSTISRRHFARQAASSTVGPWQLVRLVGAGCWTQVFQARPLASSEHSATDYLVKTLQPALENEPRAIALLQREAHVAAQVRHPNLTAILSSHVELAPRYLVMPCLAGATLRQAIDITRRIPTAQALWLARQSAEGLAALHQAGWLHADVKPDNLFVCDNGHAILLDLGLAKRIGQRAAEEPLAATLAYAAPEVFTPHIAAGPASDVYSLGVTLYEMLTGGRPFAQDDPTELAAAHLTAVVPDPRRVLPQLAARVSRLLRQMLAKEPLRRPSLPELIERLCDLEIELFDERLAA